MKGKVVVITGATSGIGEIAAQRLAAMGARIVLVARDAARGQKTLTRLADISSGVVHSIYYGNLSLISETKRVAAEIRAAEPRIDVLINNAGALFGKRELTADGLEETFATNHMAYFVLTLALRDSLFAASSARVVSTASAAHRGYTLDFDDLQAQKGYSAMRAYGRSKLCNILFTRELARRFRGKNVTANCLHPGFVATRFGDGSGGLIRSVLGLAKNFAITPEKGAETIVYLASSPEVSAVSGDYFYRCRPAMPTAGGRDDAAAKRLWMESAKIAAIDYE
jgi:NAD(P)-dependent dehydrogenase (short-subunit alcohol dehydrogenase family)